MKDAFGKAAAVFTSARELYRKLTRSQRIALLLVAGIVGTSLALVAASTVPESTGHASAPAAPGGAPPGERAAAAEGSTSGGSWSFPSFEMPEARDARWREAHVRKLEQTLCVGKVATATVVYMPGPGRRVIDGRGEDSASVTLRLRDGVAGLLRQEADALREQVAYALRVRPEKVALMDDRGKSYPWSGGEGGVGSLYEDESSWRLLIQKRIGEYYSRLYHPSDFHVAVEVFLTQEATVIEKESFIEEKSFSKPRSEDSERVEQRADGPAGGIGGAGPASGPVVRSIKVKTEEEVFPSRETVRTSVPRGNIESLSVNLLLDRSAVERQVLPPRSGLGDDLPDAPGAPSRESILDAYREEQEAALSSLLSLYKPTVKVVIDSFAVPESDAALAPSLPLELAVAAPGGNGWMPTLLVASGALALGIGASILLWKRRSRDFIVDPDLAVGERAHGEDTGGADRVGEVLRGRSRSRLAGSRKGVFRDELLRAVEETSARVRRRPEVAAAVLRSWLAQGADDPMKGAGRS